MNFFYCAFIKGQFRQTFSLKNISRMTVLGNNTLMKCYQYNLTREECSSTTIGIYSANVDHSWLKSKIFRCNVQVKMFYKNLPFTF